MLKNNHFALKGDKTLFILPLIFSLFGLLMILDVSSATATRDFHNKFYFFDRQAVSLLIGTGFFLFFSFFDFRHLKKTAVWIFLINMLFLILVLIPGFGREVYGGRRWLQLGPIGFQPSETAKLSLIIYLSTLFEKKRKLLPFILSSGCFLLLIILEPDLGTAGIVIASAVCLFFISGSSLKHILGIMFLGILLFPALIFFSPYRKQRLFSFFGSFFNANVEKTSYHVKQILIALGGGGFWGRGFGQSRQKFLFLPEVATDSIFAVIAEEFGFFGSALLIVSFLFLFFRGFKTALQTTDFFGRTLACGIIFFLSFQSIINLSSIVSLIPLTGVPLPFISYGGSSLIVSLSGMGIVYNVSRRN